MVNVVLFGISSTIIVDIEESLYRAGCQVAAGVRNHPNASQLSEGLREVQLDALDPMLVSLPYLVPLFTPANRQAAVNEALTHGFSQPFTLIDPTVIAPRHIQIGKGTYINCGCCLGGASIFEDFVFINRGASIGHHVHAKSFVSIGPGAVIAGHVSIGRNVLIGAGATVLPKISIGEDAIVAAGAVVTRDVPPKSLVVGNPGRIVGRDSRSKKSLKAT